MNMHGYNSYERVTSVSVCVCMYGCVRARVRVCVCWSGCIRLIHNTKM